MAGEPDYLEAMRMFEQYCPTSADFNAFHEAFREEVLIPIEQREHREPTTDETIMWCQRYFGIKEGAGMSGGRKSDEELIRIAKQIHGEDYAHLPEADFVRGFIIGWRRLPSPDKYRDDDSFQTGVQVAQIQSPDSESDSDSASSGDMGDGDLASESDDDDEHKSGSGMRRIDFYGRARPHFCE